MTARPLHELPDLVLAAMLARLDNERGGNLRQRILRAEAIRGLESEQDRRTCERIWALPTFQPEHERGGALVLSVLAVAALALLALLLVGAFDAALGGGVL